MLLKSTTRHIRIYTAEVKNNQLIESNNVLTLDVDPDNEFNWEEVALNKVYSKFDELVESYNGEELSEYNLRRIGSDLEHFIRSLLQKGEISYNLNARVQNYSMGLPKLGWTIPRTFPTRTPRGVGNLPRGNEEFHSLGVREELPVIVTNSVRKRRTLNQLCTLWPVQG